MLNSEKKWWKARNSEAEVNLRIFFATFFRFLNQETLGSDSFPNDEDDIFIFCNFLLRPTLNLFSQVGFVPYTILKSLVYRDAPTYWEVHFKMSALLQSPRRIISLHVSSGYISTGR